MTPIVNLISIASKIWDALNVFQDILRIMAFAKIVLIIVLIVWIILPVSLVNQHTIYQIKYAFHAVVTVSHVKMIKLASLAWLDTI